VASLAELNGPRNWARPSMLRLRNAGARERRLVHLSVNEGRAGGASIRHTHAQLYAFDFVPALMRASGKRFGAYCHADDGRQPARGPGGGGGTSRERVVAIDDEAVLLAPLRPCFPIRCCSRRGGPRPRFEDDGPSGASLLGDALGRLARLQAVAPR